MSVSAEQSSSQEPLEKRFRAFVHRRTGRIPEGSDRPVGQVMEGVWSVEPGALPAESLPVAEDAEVDGLRFFIDWTYSNVPYIWKHGVEFTAQGAIAGVLTCLDTQELVIYDTPEATWQWAADPSHVEDVMGRIAVLSEQGQIAPVSMGGIPV